MLRQVVPERGDLRRCIHTAVLDIGEATTERVFIGDDPIERVGGRQDVVVIRSAESHIAHRDGDRVGTEERVYFAIRQRGRLARLQPGHRCIPVCWLPPAPDILLKLRQVGTAGEQARQRRIARRCRRATGGRGRRLTDIVVLPVGEEEQLVLDDRTADLTAEAVVVIAGERRARPARSESQSRSGCGSGSTRTLCRGTGWCRS